MGERPEWTTHHFSQANPEGADQGDVPALLRRVADSIEEMGAVDIHDLVMHVEMNENGEWPSITVYYDYGSTQA